MNRGRIQWISVGVLVCVLFFGCGRTPGDKLYEQALGEWRKGKLVRARALLEKSIRRRTGSEANAEAYNRLGVLLWEMKKPDEAADAFNNSLRIEGGRYEVLCNLGVALGEQQDLAGAGQVLREASLLKPDDPRPPAAEGILYARSGQWSEAVRSLTRAQERMPGDAALENALAICELHASGDAPALKRLLALHRQQPDYAPACYNLGVIYSQWLRNRNEARRWLQACLEKTAAESRLAGLAQARLKNIEKGSGEKIVFTPPVTPDRINADKHFRQALEYQKKNDLENAARWYIKAVESDNTYEQAFYNLGLCYYSLNRLELAADAFTRAVQINPAYTEARYNCALAEYRLGNTARALRELETLLKQNPGYRLASDLKKQIRR